MKGSGLLCCVVFTRGVHDGVVVAIAARIV